MIRTESAQQRTIAPEGHLNCTSCQEAVWLASNRGESEVSKSGLRLTLGSLGRRVERFEVDPVVKNSLFCSFLVHPEGLISGTLWEEAVELET